MLSLARRFACHTRKPQPNSSTGFGSQSHRVRGSETIPCELLSSHSAHFSTKHASLDAPRPVETPDGQLSQNRSTIQIKISVGSECREHSIQRSFPNGKPEKLTHGLTRLLSRSEARWHLSTDGDAISRFVVLQDASVVDPLQRAVRSASDGMNHHPHTMLSPYAHGDSSTPNHPYCVFGILCTTHVPHGLSLNDVKLADKIDEAVAKMQQGGGSRDLTPEFTTLKSHLETEAKISRLSSTQRKMEKSGEVVEKAQLYERFRISADARRKLERARELEAKLLSTGEEASQQGCSKCKI